MALRIYTRAEVGLAAPLNPAKAYFVAPEQRIGFFNHYDGAHFIKSDTLANAMEHWRNAQEYHQRSNGWNDIGYNYGISQGGHILEGRGLTTVGAHCPNFNLNSWGVQFMIGGDQKPSDAALTAACDLYVHLSALAGHTLLKKGHRDGYATACPGDLLYGWVKSGMPRPAGAPVLAPPAPTKPSAPAPAPRKARRPAPGPWRPFPLPPGYYFGLASGPRESVSGRYSHRQDVINLQTQFAKRGWAITVDGEVGPKTVRVIRQFQADQRLLVDGKGGRLTWKAAFENPLT
jgi:hypothetical protein